MVVKTDGAEFPRPYRWNVSDYYKLAEIGIFTEDDPVELIDGVIMDMAVITPQHAGHTICLNHLFHAKPLAAIVSVRNPVRLDEYSEPMPDIALLRWRDDFYRSGHPMPEQILLIVEIADIGVRYDRDVKIPLYARHGISEVWLLDLSQRRLEVYRRPVEDQYGEINYFQDGAIAPLALPEAIIDLAELLE